MIEQRIIDRILSATNIVDVISDNISLSKKGVNYWGVCPFHKDSSPSLCVSPTKQIFKCFACGEAGNVVTFLQKHDNINYPEAIRYLGKKCNIEVPDKELTPEEQQYVAIKESMQIVMEAATNLYTSYLTKNKEAQNYLSSRGWDAQDDDVLKTYRIGFAPDTWRTLIEDMKSGSFNTDVMISTGVASKGEKSVYDTFRGRVMFPYFDLRGSVIGFTGRTIKKDDDVKYYNTGETPIFHKGNVLYGLFQAKRSISKNDKAYFVEGQFDVLSFVRAGIENTVCGSGTALTKEQIEIIMRFTRNITLIYDEDAAGVKASIKNIKSLVEAGANVRAISLPQGEDPDSFARRMSPKELAIYLDGHEFDWVTYLSSLYKVDFGDPIKKNEHFNSIVECIAFVDDQTLRYSYMSKLSDHFKISIEQIVSKIKEIKKTKGKKEDVTKAGFFGVEELESTLEDISENCMLTDKFSEFKNLVGDKPIVYVSGLPAIDQIQEFRRHAAYLQYTYSSKISFDERRESDMLTTLCSLFKAGFTIYVEYEEKNFEFVDFYIRLYAYNMDDKTGDVKTIYYGRCADIIASASETSQSVMEKEWQSILKLNGKAFKDLIKPYRDKKKSKNAMLLQQSFDDSLIWDDPEIVPDYVEENEEFKTNYKRFGFYPLLNKEKEPVSYMFKNPSGGGHLQVGDFYMIPLLHIYSADREGNKKIIKINRRYYKKPLYMELKSSIFSNLNSFEETLVNEEGINFENGTVAQFKKIRQSMSYQYTMCDELKTYGQQSENFYAFSNAIYHELDGVQRIDMVSDIGVVSHGGKNYYAPAFSNIYAGLRKGEDDMYENLRYFVYKAIPLDKQCSFEQWAQLMNEVYRVNDNGKWSILYAILCAFRSDIHSIDRLFTALFFMGPTMSGKTQIAISVRSLYIDPDAPAFNLNTGTDAALMSLMEGFRDVPQVLDEYNNKDISDNKFQALKSITYDGDGKQKRKSTSGKDIETSKVLSPVIVLGQETPQRDDNALMNRVVVCEVPKRSTPFTQDEKNIFQKLKEYEKAGLCNILIEILKLRPIVRKEFKRYMRQINKDLTKSILAREGGSGDMVRIINTITLFLSMCKLLEEQAPQLKLPFTYEEFYEIAKRKVISQVEMITRTDKLAGFFKAMEVMINSHALVDGRDFAIDQPEKLTFKLPGNERKETPIPVGTKVLYLRLSIIHTLYAKSSYNTEDSSQSTIEANIRSNPAYMGVVNSRRFKWKEVKEVPKGDIRGDGTVNNEMVRIMDTKTTMTSCIALNYDTFRQYFDIDLEREEEPESDKKPEQDMPF